jgi:hypothetical protein
MQTFTRSVLAEASEARPKILHWGIPDDENFLALEISGTTEWVWSDEFVVEIGKYADELWLTDPDPAIPAFAVNYNPFGVQPYALTFVASSPKVKAEFLARVTQMLDDPEIEVFISADEQKRRGEEFSKNVLNSKK